MASVNGSELHDWLLEAAGVHTRFVDKVLGVLEAEEVVSLDDLQLLAPSPAFESCGISTLNVLKIRGALERHGQAGALPSPAEKASSMEISTVVPPMETPPARTRQAAAALVSPRVLFGAPVPAGEVVSDGEAATRLQAAVRRMLAVSALCGHRAARAIQAAARRMLAVQVRQRCAVDLRAAASYGLSPAVWRALVDYSTGVAQDSPYCSCHPMVVWDLAAWLQGWWRRRRWLRSLVAYEVPAWFWRVGGQRRVAFAGEERVFLIDRGTVLSARERFERRVNYRNAIQRAMAEVRAERGEQSADGPESVCLVEETVSRTGGHSSKATQQ